MRIIHNAMNDMLLNEREHECYGCGSKYAFVLDDVIPQRRRDFFFVIPTGYVYDNYYVECPVCSQRSYWWGDLNVEEVRYLIRKDKKQRAEAANGT